MVKSDLVTYGGGTERYLFFSVANDVNYESLFDQFTAGFILIFGFDKNDFQF